MRNSFEHPPALSPEREEGQELASELREKVELYGGVEKFDALLDGYQGAREQEAKDIKDDPEEREIRKGIALQELLAVMRVNGEPEIESQVSANALEKTKARFEPFLRGGLKEIQYRKGDGAEEIQYKLAVALTKRNLQALRAQGIEEKKYRNALEKDLEDWKNRIEELTKRLADATEKKPEDINTEALFIDEFEKISKEEKVNLPVPLRTQWAPGGENFPVPVQDRAPLAAERQEIIVETEKDGRSLATPMERLSGTLEGRRAAYVEEYIRFKGMDGHRDAESFLNERPIIAAALRKNFILAGDTDRRRGGSGDVETHAANDRREKFITEARIKGLPLELANALYELELAKGEYEAAKVEYGRELYEAERSNLESQGMTGETLDQELARFRARELFGNLVVGEHEKLQAERAELWPPKERGIFRKAWDWYKKKPLWAKLALGTAVAAGAGFSGALLGGASLTGAALTGLTFAGGRVLKIPISMVGGAIGAAVGGGMAKLGIDWWNKNAGRTKTREYRTGEIQKDFTKRNFEEFLAQTSDRYSRMHEETAEREKKQGYLKTAAIVAGGMAGGMATSSLAAKLGIIPIVEVPGGGAGGEDPNLEPAKPTAQPGAVSAPSPEPMEPRPVRAPKPESLGPPTPIEHIEIARSGDSVWTMLERETTESGIFKELESQYSGDELVARKTYIIDALKDQVAKNPSAFGLSNVDNVLPGKEMDFSSIMETKDLDDILRKANLLSEREVLSIISNNEKIAAWIRVRPGERPNAHVEEILNGEVAAPELAMPDESRWPTSVLKVEPIEQAAEVPPPPYEFDLESATERPPIIDGPRPAPKFEKPLLSKVPEQSPTGVDAVEVPQKTTGASGGSAEFSQSPDGSPEVRIDGGVGVERDQAVQDLNKVIELDKMPESQENELIGFVQEIKANKELLKAAQTSEQKELFQAEIVRLESVMNERYPEILRDLKQFWEAEPDHSPEHSVVESAPEPAEQAGQVEAPPSTDAESGKVFGLGAERLEDQDWFTVQVKHLEQVPLDERKEIARQIGMQEEVSGKNIASFVLLDLREMGRTDNLKKLENMDQDILRGLYKPYANALADWAKVAHEAGNITAEEKTAVLDFYGEVQEQKSVIPAEATPRAGTHIIDASEELEHEGGAIRFQSRVEGVQVGVRPEDMLKGDWRETVLNRATAEGKNVNFELNKVEAQTRVLITQEKRLKSLDSGSPEAEALQKVIQHSKQLLKTQYGEIFK